MKRKLYIVYFAISIFITASVMTLTRPSVDSLVPIIVLFISVGLSVFFGVRSLLAYLKVSDRYAKIVSTISGVGAIAIIVLSSFASISPLEVAILIAVTLIITWYLHRLS